MSKRGVGGNILSSQSSKQEQEHADDMESQDSEITAFSEINIEPFQKQYINGQSTPIDGVDALDTDIDNLPYPTALPVSDENYQESLTKQAFSQVYMPMNMQYNPDGEQQYVSHGDVIQMPPGYLRTYAGQQFLAQRQYQLESEANGHRRPQEGQQSNYNHEKMNSEHQQYGGRIQTINIPTPTPEVLAQFNGPEGQKLPQPKQERVEGQESQEQEEQETDQQQQSQQQAEMYVNGSEGGVNLNLPANCCIQYAPSTTSMAAHQELVGRQPARIVNGKKIGVKPINPKFDRTRKFPEKLYSVACDPNIDFIRWSATGKAIIVNEKEFERRVMSDCPGLVQSDAFDNFRRQLREYQFECRYINMPFQYDYEFLHSNFQYERDDLLHRVKTRRRAMRHSQGSGSSVETSPPLRAAIRRSNNGGGRRSRGSCGNPSCHHHHPPTPQGPWPYNAGGYASGDAPLPGSTMYPAGCTHLGQWASAAAAQAQAHTHGYGCSHVVGTSSPDDGSSNSQNAGTEDNQWQNAQGQMWYSPTANPTPQALYSAASWYHPQAPATSITQPVTVMQNPQLNDTPVSSSSANNTMETMRESNENTEDGQENREGEERGGEGNNHDGSSSPVTVQIRQQDQRVFAGLQKLSVGNNMANMGSMQPLVYTQLESGAGDSMQLQQPDSQPQQTSLSA